MYHGFPKILISTTVRYVILCFLEITHFYFYVQSDSRKFKRDCVIDHLYRSIENKCFFYVFTDADVFTEGSLPALRTKDEGSCSQPSQIIIQLRKQVIISYLAAVMVMFCFSSSSTQVSLYISLFISGSFI